MNNKSKSIIRRLIAFVLVLTALLGVIPIGSITASAASNKISASASTTISKVAVDTSKYYVATKKTALRSGTGLIYSTVATLPQGAVVVISGSTGDFYKVMMTLNGKNTTYYVKKADMKKAASTMEATFCYTVSNAVLRNGPFEDAKKLETVAKGTALRIVGKPAVNRHGNTWYTVLTSSNQLAYVYAERVKTVSKITLTVSGYELLETGNKVKFTYAVTPSAIKNVQWSSSNKSIATVDISGNVKAVAGGTVAITAAIPGVLSVSVKNVNCYLNVSVVHQSTSYTCSAASTKAVLSFYNVSKVKNMKDTTLQKETDGYVYKIRDTLNKYLGSKTYVYGTFSSTAAFENAIRNSLKQGSAVIARVAFEKKWFNYASTGHYTTIVGCYEKNGTTWLIVVDSYANRYASTTYANAKTGIVHVPLNDMFRYCSYNGTSARYLVYNP